MSPVYVHPHVFERCVDQLCHKLQQIAGRAGVPDHDCCDLESTLAAMPRVCRSQAQAMLNGLQLQTYDDFPAMAFAAKYVLNLAQQIWWEERPASLEAPAL